MGLLFREYPKAQPEGGFRFHSFDRVFQPEGGFRFHSFDRVFRDIHNVQDINSA